MAPEEWEGESSCRKEYMELVGCLIYIANSCRPDVCTMISMLASHMANPSPDHLSAARRVLVYLYHSRPKGLEFKRQGVKGMTDKAKIKNMRLSAHFDSDLENSKKDRN